MFLTLVTLATAISAFLFSVWFKQDTDNMNKNFVGEVTRGASDGYDLVPFPCVRNTLADCSNDVADECRPNCCPGGYECRRDQVVGLICKNPSDECDDFLWCRDFADISGNCQTEICEADKMVESIAQWAYVFSGMGVLLDMFDIMMFFISPNYVVVKSLLNFASSCIKWVAMNSLIGSGALDFVSQLQVAGCYNPYGMTMIRSAQSTLMNFLVLQGASATLSLVLAPFSAYFGGKLVGVPYVK